MRACFFGSTDQECSPTAIKEAKLQNNLLGLKRSCGNQIVLKRKGEAKSTVSTFSSEENSPGGGLSLPNLVC